MVINGVKSMEYSSVWNKKGYIQISRLLLDKRSSEPREEVHNLLVEIGIFSNMMLKDWLTLEEIQKSIASEIGIETFPREPLKRAVSRLVKEKRIIIQENQQETLYSLAKERKEQLQKYKTEVNELYNTIISSLITNIENEFGKLDSYNIKTITNIFDSTISNIFSALENESIAILVGETKERNIQDVIGKFKVALNKITDSGLRRIVSSAIRDTILNPTKEMKQYMLLCATNSFILKLLNLDPSCQSLERKIFSGMTLYLDTNILISALYPSHELHSTTSEVLRESNKLGVNLTVTSRTLEELNKVIDRTDEVYTQHKTATTRSKFYTPENTIIETFVRYAETKGDTWETYILAQRKYPSILDRQYQIKFDDTDYKTFIAEEKITELSKIVQQCSQIRITPKSDDVAEHDAYHFLVIDYLRQQSRSNNIWFLSHDRTFDCVNQGYFKLENKSLPCSISCSSWLEVIFPFLSPDVSQESFEDVFIKAVSSDFFSLTKSLSFGNLTKFFIPFFNDEFLTDEDYVSILQDQVLKRIAEEWKASGYSSEYDEQLIKTITDLIDKRKEEKIKKMEKELKNKNKKIKEMSKQLDATERSLKYLDTNTTQRIKDLEMKYREVERRFESERERRIKNRRFGELFIGLLVIVVYIILLWFLASMNALSAWTWIEVTASCGTIGVIIIGIYHWITKESETGEIK